MRLPRFRFTVRRLMVVVAIVGLAIGNRKASETYSRRAEQFNFLQHELIVFASDDLNFFAKLDYCAEMERRNRRAPR
jgi:hypothetical protein